MITKKKLNNFLYNAVEIEDIYGKIEKGWFAKQYNDYALFPFDDIWHISIYKVGCIKRIKFLTNGFEIKRGKK